MSIDETKEQSSNEAKPSSNTKFHKTKFITKMVRSRGSCKEGMKSNTIYIMLHVRLQISISLPFFWKDPKIIILIYKLSRKKTILTYVRVKKK